VKHSAKITGTDGGGLTYVQYVYRACLGYRTGLPLTQQGKLWKVITILETQTATCCWHWKQLFGLKLWE